VIFFDGGETDRRRRDDFTNPDHFIRVSDSLYIACFMVVFNPKEELECGGFYFRQLSASDIAAVLRKADSAIRSTGCRSI
jgi:hypothetical protein